MQLGSWDRKGLRVQQWRKIRPRAEVLEERVYGFYNRGHRGLLTILLFELLFHLAGVVRNLCDATCISPIAASKVTRGVYPESVNRIINVAV